VTWAFPSFSKIARARGRGVGAPMASSRNATPPVLPSSPLPPRTRSSLFSLLNNFAPILVTSSSCLVHCTRPRLPYSPFDLFSSFHSRISTPVISPNSFSSIPACPVFLAVFLKIPLVPLCSSTRPEPLMCLLLTKTLYSLHCLDGVRNDVRGRIEDECFDKCLDVCVPCCLELYIAE
jgi:hypothetical protein